MERQGTHTGRRAAHLASAKGREGEGRKEGGRGRVMDQYTQAAMTYLRSKQGVRNVVAESTNGISEVSSMTKETNCSGSCSESTRLSCVRACQDLSNVSSTNVCFPLYCHCATIRSVSFRFVLVWYSSSLGLDHSLR